MVALLEPCCFGYDTPDFVDDTGNLVAQCDRGRDVCVRAEVSVDQLDVRTTHPAGLNPDENLVGLDLGDRNVLEDESLAIFVHACRFHSCCLPFTVLGYEAALFLCVFSPPLASSRRYLRVLDPNGLRVYKGVRTEV